MHQQPHPPPLTGALGANRTARAGIPRWVLFVAAGMAAATMLGAITLCGIGAIVLVAMNRERKDPGEQWRITVDEARSAEEKRRAAAEPGTSEEAEAPTWNRPMADLSPAEREAAAKAFQLPPTERVENGWTIRDEPAAKFRATFPAQPTTIDPLTQITLQPGAEASPDAQRAMLEQLGMRVVVAEHDGRKYMVVATPMPLDETMISIWLDAADRTLRLHYRGYDVEPAASGQIDGRPYRDFLVRFENDIKLVRLTPGEGFVYSINVESASSAADLTFDDPTARRFFAGFKPL